MQILAKRLALVEEYLEKYGKILLSIEEVSARREEFCRLYKDHMRRKHRRSASPTCNEDLIARMPDFCVESLFKKLFSSLLTTDEDKKFFLKFALQEHSLGFLEELEKSGLDIYKCRFDDGRSALHYVADLYESKEISSSLRASYIDVIEHFLRNAGTSDDDDDDHGYSLLHAACMLGPANDGPALLTSLLRRGAAVDVRRDTGYKWSPLHVAAQYRHAEIVQILLDHGAAPNQLDHEGATPLHALARLNADDYRPADWADYKDSEQWPADEIVRLLVEAGADLGARNRHGDTAVQLALASLDPDLARVLLRHDDKDDATTMDGLSEDRMFRIDLSSIESKCRLIRSNVIGTVRLLRSRGYFTDLFARLRAAKCWIRAREDDAFHRICQENGDERYRYRLKFIVKCIYVYRKFGLYIKEEDMDALLQRRENLRSRLPEDERDYECDRSTINMYTRDFEAVKKIKITEDVSLYRLCQMNYEEGYSIIKNIKNWGMPPLDNCISSDTAIVLRRHVANLLTKNTWNLELLAADLFMTDYCSLNMPYTVCRQVAGNMSEEDLLRLFEKVDENDLRRSLEV